MSRVKPRVRNFARRITACAAREDQATETSPAAFHACDRLRAQLTTLMGTTGVRTLLARSLALAGAEVAWLRAMHINADGTLGRLDQLAGRLAPDELAQGGVVLLSHLLELLIAFIGEALTLQLMSDVWPELSPNDLAASGDDR